MADKRVVMQVLSCSMCSKIVNNPKTLYCYHSFCHKCVQKLQKKTDDEGISGMTCSVCRFFSYDSKIKSSMLINELLEMYQIAEKGESGICEQCMKKKSTCKCVDCKMTLCEDCQELHSRVPLLKNHRVVSLKSEKDSLVIDRVVFCEVHEDEPVKLNCIDCAAPLCIKCKVTEHENHKTETVEKAINRITPMLQQECKQIEDKAKELEKIHGNVLQKITETKQVFCKCRLDADKNLKQLNDNAKTQHKEISESLILREEEEIAKLEIAKEKIEYKLKECQNIQHWVDVTAKFAKGTSLLSEFETGLYSRVRDLATSKFTLSTVIDHPSLEANKVLETMENMIGTIKYDKVIAVSSNVSNNGKHTHLPLLEVFEKPLRVLYNIQLPGLCYRIAVINGNIWIPVPNQNLIQVYNPNGELQRTIQIPRQPRSVAQLSNGEIVVASATGLFMLDKDEQVSTELSKQNFGDLDIIDDVIAALNYNTGQYNEFIKVNGEWKSSHVYSLYRGVANGSVIKFKRGFLTTTSAVNLVQKYNSSGEILLEIGIYASCCSTTENPGRLYTPYLCAMDDSGSLLIADYSNARIQVFTEYEWKVVCTKQVISTLSNPYDCKIDDEAHIWISNGASKLLCLG